MANKGGQQASKADQGGQRDRSAGKSDGKTADRQTGDGTASTAGVNSGAKGGKQDSAKKKPAK